MNKFMELFMNPYEKFYLNKLQQNPEDLHAMLRLGELYLRKNNKKKGLQLLIEVSKKFYEKGKIEYSLAINRILKRKFPELNIDIELSEKKDLEKISTIEILKDIEIFKDFPDEYLKFLEQNSNIKKYLRNDAIIKEGEEIDSFYVILKGHVKIYISNEDGKVKEICILGKGDFFGEMSFFESTKRNIFVNAIDDVLLLEIPRNVIEELKKNDEKVNEILLKYYQRSILNIILSSSENFISIDENLKREIISSIKLIKFQPGEIIIKQGESQADTMYIIKSGIVEVFKDEEDTGKKIKVAELTEGDVIGEIEVLTGQKRTVTVKAKTEVELMELDKKNLDRIISKYPNFLDILKEITQKRMAQSFMKQPAIKKGIV